MPSSIPFCFAIASTFTAEPIATCIEFWGNPLQSKFWCSFAPFGQILQTVLDQQSVFATNQHGLNVLLLRWSDLGEPSRRLDNAQALVGAIEARVGAWAVPLLVVCDEAADGWWRDISGAYLLPAGRIDAWYPVGQKLSADGEKLGGIPYTEEYFVALGSAVVRAAHGILHSPYKVLALDCDHTLWQGICGEDGPDGVRLGSGHAALQRFAIEQRKAGMLIALSSKNNMADVRETFEQHPEFPLQWSDISATKIDWNPKPLGLAAMAAELSLGLDSFVFLDDNPKEISEVDEQLPQVLGLTLPEDPNDFERFLNHVWAFDRLKLTSADEARVESYQGVQEFGKELHEAGSLDHFHSTLELEVEIRAVSEAEIPRAAQLTQRTNQFNLTTIRRSEPGLLSLMRSGIELFGVHVRDRFGDYGFTGLLVGHAWNGEYKIENFLLSCRVLGRGVEHQVFAWIGRHARELKCAQVFVPFAASTKNAPAKDFLTGLGWTVFPARGASEQLASLRFESRRTERGTIELKRTVAAEHTVDYGSIARELTSVAAIRRRMRKHNAVRLETETETRLAVIWQDLLEVEMVAGESNFFDLGGHSLKVVLLLMRVREEFAVGLGIEDVYASEVTLERMARRIDELVHFGGVGHAEYTRILGAIEIMTEEEAEAALGEESGQNADPVSR